MLSRVRTPRTLLVLSTIALVACSSSSSSSPAPSSDSGALVDSASDTIVDAPIDAPVDAPAAPYSRTIFDAARIGSDSSKPNFQKVEADVQLDRGPYAEVKLVLDLSSTCFPFSNWATDKPPSGQNWPADCDAFDRNYETHLIDPAAGKDALPLELVRAITPFGGPLHIEQDVTDVFNFIDGGKRTVRVVIPSYSDGAGKVSGSNGGWKVSAHLEVTPGDAPHRVLSVVSLANGNVGAKDVPADLPFTLPAGTTSSRIEYRVTGHGGADGGTTSCIGPAEEFCRRQHHVTIDGAKLDDFTPWRNDCRKLCTIQHESTIGNFDYCAENPCGAVSSVRAPRANWCPGSLTPPFSWTPDALKSPGKHAFKYAIDGVVDGGTWRVSATLFAYGD